jgi:hypothetical protein
MSERDEPQQRPAMPEYDRFGFRGHFDPACGSDDDRSSVRVISELNRTRRSEKK